MIKGHSYDKQLYYSVADRLINKTFLNDSNGIFKQEGNACELNYTNDAITIADGFFVIQGGLTEIKGSETLSVVLNDTYCILVYELDMQRQNSETDFTQGQFKILSGQNAYPTMTKQKLTENQGIYQYEFARFVANSKGISNFKDSRTFLDYNSIFAYIKEQIEQIEESTIYVTKDEFRPIKESAEKFDDSPIIIVQEKEPTPIKDKTIVWLKPKG